MSTSGDDGGATVDKGITLSGNFGTFLDTTRGTGTGNVLNLNNFTVDWSGNTLIYGTVAIGSTGAFALSVSGRATFGTAINLNYAGTTGSCSVTGYIAVLINGVSKNIPYC